MFKKEFSTIRVQLIIAFIVLSIFPLLIGGGILIWQSYTNNIENIFVRQNEIAKRTKLEIKSYFLEVEYLINDLHRFQNFFDFNISTQKAMLSQLIGEQRLFFREVILIDENGVEKIKLSNTKFIHELKDISKKDIFFEPKKSAKKYYSDIIYENAEPMMYISIPFIDENSGKVKAILATLVRLKPIWSLFTNLHYIDGESIYLVDSNNCVIAHQDPSIVLRNTCSFIQNKMRLQKGLNGEYVFGFVEELKLANRKFKIIIEDTLLNAISPALKNITIIVIIILITMALAFILFIFAIKRIISPIEMVSNGANAIENGDFSKRIKIKNLDEIGKLANSFNQMSTKLQKAFSKLAESEERFRRLAENAHDMIYKMKLPSGEYEYVSPASTQITGYSPEEFYENPMIIKTIMHPKWINYFDREWKKLLNGDISNTYEYKIIDKVGNEKWLYQRNVLVKDKNENVIAIEGIVTDITDRKVMERKLAELNKNLAKKVKNEVEKRKEQEQILIGQSKMAALGEMIGNIAHQWRQPLNALALTVQDVLEAYEANELSREYLEESVDKSMERIEYMSETIDDFRNFFKKDKIKREFDILKAVKSSSEIVKPQLKAHNITLNIQGENIEILGLENEFKQVIINIINNSKDAILEIQKDNEEFEGKIKVEILNLKSEIIIELSDNGGGVKKEIMDKVFEPYFTTKFQSQGVGIGLFMSKMIIEKNMSGHLSVENIDNGAKFIIKIPKLEEEN